MEYIESLMQSRYDAFEDMITDYYEELEGFVSCCMAAGVPADMFIITIPKLDHNFDNTVCVTTHIGFKQLQDKG